MVATSMIILGILAALAGGAAIYEYEQNQSNTTPTTSSSTAQTDAGVTNPNLPPLLYDPIIDQLPNPSKDVAVVNPVVYNDEYESQSNPTGTSTIVPTNTIVPSSNNAQAPSSTASVQAAISAAVSNVQNYISTAQSTNSANAQSIATNVASSIDSLVSKYGPLDQSSISKIGSSAGTGGYAVVPVLNSSGKVTGATVVNAAQDYNNKTNNVVVTSNPTGGSVNSVAATAGAPNTVIGYTHPLNSGYGTGTQTYAAGSSYQGAADYVNSLGQVVYVNSPSSYKYEVHEGFLGVTKPPAGSVAAGNTATALSSSQDKALTAELNKALSAESASAKKASVKTATTNTVVKSATPSSAISWMLGKSSSSYSAPSYSGSSSSTTTSTTSSSTTIPSTSSSTSTTSTTTTSTMPTTVIPNTVKTLYPTSENNTYENKNVQIKTLADAENAKPLAVTSPSTGMIYSTRTMTGLY